MNSVKTALLFLEWMEEKDEEFLLETFDVRPGEVHAKLSMAAWLLYSMEEIAKLMRFHNQVKDITKARIRLRYGVKEELLALLKLEGIGRTRARRLFNNSIKNILNK